MARFAELADGRRLEFPDDTPDDVIVRTVKRIVSEYAALQAANSKYTVNPDPASPMSRFVGGVASSLNPITIGKGIYQAVTSPLDTISALGDAQIDTGAKADIAEREGRGVEAAGYRLASGIPIVGPMLAGLGEQAGSGDIAGAAGSLTGAALVPGVYGKALSGAKAAAPAVSQAVGNAAGSVGRGAVAAAKAVGPELVGAAAGAAMAGGYGGVLGGVVGNAARRVVKEWFQKRFKMSEAKATEMASKLPEAEVVRIAKEAMPEAAAPPVGPMRPSPMSGSAPAGSASVPVPPQPAAPMSSGMGSPVAIDPSRLNQVPGAVPPRPAPTAPAGMSGTSFTPVAVDPGSLNQVRMTQTVRPIPPQKLPPVLPDPVVPELAVPVGSSAKLPGSGQNARDWLQKYAEAGKGGTKEEIAAARAKLVKGLSGKLTYEDMRQLGAYTDDIATVNPGAPPPAAVSTFRPVKLEDVHGVSVAEADDLLAKLEASIKNPKLRDQVAVERAKRSKKLRTKENK